MKIGKNAYYFEDYVLSIQYFNQVIKVKPYLAEPYMFRGMAKISLGDYIGAEQDCNEAIRLNPFVPFAYYTRGFARKNLDKFEEAIFDFTKALEFDPDNSHYIANRIEVKEKNKDYEGAIEDLNYFKRLNPNAKGIEYEIGRILLVSNDTIGAEEMARKNIEIDSTMELSYKLLAHIKEKKKDIDGAINCLNELQRINPKSENVNVELGRLHLAQNDTTSALFAFNRAIQLEPNKPYAYGARAYIRMVQNDEKAAMEDYSKAIEKGSEFSGDYINRGILNVKKYNFNQALNDYNYAILLDRSNGLAYYNRALLRNNLGDKNNALSDLKRVVELDPNNHEAILQKANLELELGYLDEAILHFQEILQNYKYFAPAYYSLAEAYEKIGNKKQSNYYKSLVFEIVNNKDYYKRKQELEPKNQIVKVPTSTSIITTQETLADKLSQQSEDNKIRKSNYTDKLRGKIQENYAELAYISNADITFENVDSALTSTNRFNEVIYNFNKSGKFSKELKVSIINKTINAGNVQPHFDYIEELSNAINLAPNDADLYFARAVEFETVQDYSSALEDLNTAIRLNDELTLAYFARANVRIKLMEFETFSAEENESKQLTTTHLHDDKNKINRIQVIQDYDKVILLEPDFSFAYYNKANYLASIKEYTQSVQNYTKAIELDAYFAEAYFGRGLSYIFLNEEEPAKMDLSKAGELGVYRAYNLLNRLLFKIDNKN